MIFCKNRCCIGALAPVRAEPEWTQPVGHRDGQLFTASGGSSGTASEVDLGGIYLKLNNTIGRGIPISIPLHFKSDVGTAEEAERQVLSVADDGTIYYDENPVGDSTGFYNPDDSEILIYPDSKVDIHSFIYLVQNSKLFE